MRSLVPGMLVVCCACGVAGGGSGAAPPANEASAPLLVDGSTTGPAGFFFLRPLGARRHAMAGDTSPTLRPEVRVDEVDPATGAVLAAGPRFALDDGSLRLKGDAPGCERDEELLGGAFFEARWKTSRRTHRVGAVHRVRVLLDAHELGFADVSLVRAGHPKHQAPAGTTPLVPGQVLKIRFVLNASAVDRDEDGVFDWRDNCPGVANPSQLDSVGDGLGDACRCEAVTCGPLDACHVAAACEPTTGLCSHRDAPDGTACPTGHCVAGACEPDRCTSFAFAASQVSSAGQPWLLQALDFDGDGDVDLFAGNYFGGVSSLRNDGAGSFAPVSSSYSPYVYSLGVADMDGDGLRDAVLGNYLVSTVSIHRHLGSGLFAAPITVPVNELWAAWPIDVDADGRVDLVVGRVSGVLDVWRQLPDGSFGPPSSYDIRDGNSRPSHLAAGDLDGDGVTDLVIANKGAVVTVLLGTGGGAFGAPRHFRAGTYPARVALADLDGDGRLDAVSLNTVSNDVSVFHGNGDGSLALTATLPVLAVATNDAPAGLAVTDLDGDGRHDLVATSWHGNAVVAFLAEAGGWSPAVTLATLSEPAEVSAADFDGDGKVDLAIPSPNRNQVEVLLNRCQ